MAKKLPMNYALQPRDVDIVAALADGFGSTLKVCSHKSNAITLTPFASNPHSARMFHTSRIAIQGVLVEIVRRIPKRKR
jgi:SOS-response transcriptional repressor LexA